MDWNPKEVEELRELYTNGMEMVDIYSHFHYRTRASVSKKLYKLKSGEPMRYIQKKKEKCEVIVPMPLTDNELKFDLRRYAISLKKKLKQTKTVLGKPIVHVGATYVVVQGKRYRESYSYLELKEVGVKCQ